MLTVEYSNINIVIEFECPKCDKELSETIDREPDSFDTDCSACGEVFTVKCYGEI